MRAQLLAGVRAVLVLTVLCGLIYPLAVLGVSQLVFPDKANGSLVKQDGVVVGSRLRLHRRPLPQELGQRRSAHAHAQCTPLGLAVRRAGRWRKFFYHGRRFEAEFRQKVDEY